MVHNYSSIMIANRRFERRQLNDFADTKTSRASDNALAAERTTVIVVCAIAREDSHDIYCNKNGRSSVHALGNRQCIQFESMHRL